ncbi:hypothetical protein CYMTET_43950 [Cymbomonas tetramitiformis]|uniref:SMODS and SLOG-associating 2TM effector domain-containing protein n=1 Tax=Cymbomonas tetramitiformis TaxID=36881 RepID=A0AAE0EZH7_9CHLO|nr:hypothetical protein CYMTET_43950 [Cymbomonas tetramitiformis]
MRSGVSQLMGYGAADRGYATVSIGVVPLAKCFKSEELERAAQNNETLQMPRMPLEERRKLSSDNDTLTELDSNHSHFILFPSTRFGGETSFRFVFEEAISHFVPKVTILANGSSSALNLVLMNVRNKRPVIIVKGTGDLAEEVAKHWEEAKVQQNKEINEHEAETNRRRIDQEEEEHRAGVGVSSTYSGENRADREQRQVHLSEYKGSPDHSIAELVNDGNFLVFDLFKQDITDIRLLITQCLCVMPEDDNGQIDKTILLTAWRTYQLYHHNANRQKQASKAIRMLLISMQMLSTVSTVLNAQFLLNDTYEEDVTGEWMKQKFYYLIIVVPVIVGVIQAMHSKFNPSSKWLMLRSCAQKVRSEIYMYRMRVQHYAKAATSVSKDTRTVQLAKSLEEISKELVASDVNSSALLKPGGAEFKTLLEKLKARSIEPMQHSERRLPAKMGAGGNSVHTMHRVPSLTEKSQKRDEENLEGDDAVSRMMPEEYLAYRIMPEIAYYNQKSPKVEFRLNALQVASYILSALGAILATIHLELYVVITVTIAGVLTTITEQFQYQTKLIKSNRAVNELQSIHTWWRSLSAVGKASPVNVRKLVMDTEGVLENECASRIKLSNDQQDDSNAQASKADHDQKGSKSAASKEKAKKEKANSLAQKAGGLSAVRAQKAVSVS